MLLISNTLNFMLKALGINEYLLKFGTEKEFTVDENLFLGDLGLNRFMFTKITYYLFCLLDKNMAYECLGTLMHVENPDEYNVFVSRTVAWLQGLSHTFELLRYVPISSNLFYDCSGPLMHQVMFAFTMAVVKETVFDNGVTTLTAKINKAGKIATFEKSNYDANYKLFMNMVTDKNNINRKSFEADLFEHLLTRVYGKESKEMVLKSHPTPAYNVNMFDTAQQQGSSNQNDADSVFYNSTERSPTQEGFSDELDTTYPWNHKGRRVQIRRPFFRQKSPLNENGALKPVPTASIWDLDLRPYHEKEQSPYVHLMKFHQYEIGKAIEEEYLAYERMEAEKMETRRKAEKQRLEAQKKARERRLAARKKARERRSAARKKARERRSAARKKVRDQRVEARKKAGEQRLAAKRVSQVRRSANKEKGRERRSKALKKARKQVAAVEKKEIDQMLAVEKEEREQGAAVGKEEREQGAPAEKEEREQSLAAEKKEEEERGEAVDLDQENYRGIKRKSEEVQESSTSTKRNKRAPLHTLY